MPSTPNATDPIFGMHAEALSVHRRRMELIASNLANADTPNFKAQDLDFKAVLQQAAGGGALDTTHAAHLKTATPGIGPDGVYTRTATQNSLDGNTVDAQLEQAAFADSAVHYQASLMFAESRV